MPGIVEKTANLVSVVKLLQCSSIILSTASEGEKACVISVLTKKVRGASPQSTILAQLAKGFSPVVSHVQRKFTTSRIAAIVLLCPARDHAPKLHHTATSYGEYMPRLIASRRMSALASPSCHIFRTYLYKCYTLLAQFVVILVLYHSVQSGHQAYQSFPAI